MVGVSREIQSMCRFLLAKLPQGWEILDGHLDSLGNCIDSISQGRFGVNPHQRSQQQLDSLCLNLPLLLEIATIINQNMKLLAFTCLILTILCQSKGEVLMDPSVYLLDSENFYEVTGLVTPIHKKGSGNATHDWFILFYKSVCTKCEKTIPRWNEFSRNVMKGYSNKPVRIGAIDCSLSVKLCSEYNIDGYPEAVFLTKDKNRNSKNFKGQYTADGFLEFLNYGIPFSTKQSTTLLSSFIQTFRYFTVSSFVIFLLLGTFLAYIILSLCNKDNFEEIAPKSSDDMWTPIQNQKI